MHLNSLLNLTPFCHKYIRKHDKVLDVGSLAQNENGKSYRKLLDAIENISYDGLDVIPGPNVDIVAKDPYNWEIKDSTYDIIISGNTFEHIEFFWLTIKEMARVLKPGGYVWLSAPSWAKEHRFPLDCWRFYSDGMRALAKWADLRVISIQNDEPAHVGSEGKYDIEPNDCIGIFRKRRA